MKVVLKHSFGYNHFKKQIGHSNHFLITILVGLNEVEKGRAKISNSFNVCWNPKDVVASARRSAIYSLNSSLAWVVDNFDTYVDICKRKPKLIEDKDLSSEIDKANRSVNEKFKVLFLCYKDVAEIKFSGALVALMIQWRIIAVHQDADNVLDDEFENFLISNKEWYANNCRHLDIMKALDGFKEHRNPSFKELASMIKAMLDFVEHVDFKLLERLDVNRYIKDLIDFHYEDKKDENRDKMLKNRRTLIATLPRERQIRLAKNILLSNGFAESKGEEGILLDGDFIDNYLIK